MDVIMSGVIAQVLPVQSGVSQRSGQPWAKGAYVLQHENGQYPRYICFEVFGQDNINNFNLQVGESVSVHLNIDSHANPKNPSQWFNEIRCWKVDRMGQQQYQPMPQQGYQPAPQYQQPVQQQFPPQAPFPPQQPAPQPTPQPQGQQQGLPFPPAQ